MDTAGLRQRANTDRHAPSIQGGGVMVWLTVVLTPLTLALAGQISTPLFFAEGFEDTKLASRGWYDGDRFVLSDDAVAGKHAVQYRFASGKLTPSDSAGVRHLFEPTEVVYLRFYLK